MDTDKIQEEIDHNKKLIKEYENRRRHLEVQVAQFGPLHVEPHIKREIEVIAENIKICEEKLQINYLLLGKHNSGQVFDYGVRIFYPQSDPVTGTIIEVRGVYTIMPPSETLRLFTVDPAASAEYGGEFWPQDIVKDSDFEPKTKTWRTHVNLGTLPKIGSGITAAIVNNPSTVALWNFYYRVGPNVGWWGIQGWPDDCVICDRITITRA